MSCSFHKREFYRIIMGIKSLAFQCKARKENLLKQVDLLSAFSDTHCPHTFPSLAVDFKPRQKVANNS